MFDLNRQRDDEDLVRAQLGGLRKRRRREISETFENLEYAYEDTGRFGRRRPRDLAEQIRGDIGRLYDLIERLRDIREDAERLPD